ncbi:DAK2 domain-containing protein [Pseudonocardia asaccharolytica]|uniref:Dihydroxyacetone kinase n=1 Tax=Pseudonocardia asaccharolytica DSM 44247 = NBRC 16224 TaxID=1123024 RepID=A0A511D3C5_9PSEU|nr:DAK2 domain-containing protein [Pseudonocardia asaccharolytica]GEL19275.1 dihydroxyacetone kinase [Pseudonocardia asaccharolytica DSM 44247 = NBRC 16224]
MARIIDTAVITRWTAASMAALEQRCAEIDRINVFPVADRDTGTNMLLTLRAASDELHRGLRADESAPSCAAAAAALAQGALVGARGNSGVILSQVLRGLSEAITEAAGPVGGTALHAGLERARRLATAAVAQPREGTILSVLAEAARAAASTGSGSVEEVAVAAAEAAAVALRATTAQLPDLAKADVVDAGGLGLLVLLDALVEVLTGRPSSTRPVRPVAAGAGGPVRCREALLIERESGSTEFDYEVMYLLDGSDDGRMAALRGELERVGDSVAVVGDGTPGGAGLWNVHVHCTDIGAALEAGIAAGRPHRITVLRFADQMEAASPARRFVRERAVLMAVAAPQAAELAREAGADVLEFTAGLPPDEDEITVALAGTRARHVALLPGDAGLTATAERAAAEARRTGQEVVVVRSSSALQGLSALAVHDPARHAGDDVAAMAEAAAATRTGGLLVAESEALTWVGRCQPGEVLGLSDGEVVLIAPDLAVGALWLAHRMLAPGGELVTALLGADADDELGERLAEDLRRTHPEVDVLVYRGGQTDYPLMLGVE